MYEVKLAAISGFDTNILSTTERSPKIILSALRVVLFSSEVYFNILFNNSSANVLRSTVLAFCLILNSISLESRSKYCEDVFLFSVGMLIKIASKMDAKN